VIEDESPDDSYKTINNINSVREMSTSQLKVDTETVEERDSETVEERDRVNHNKQ